MLERFLQCLQRNIIAERRRLVISNNLLPLMIAQSHGFVTPPSMTPMIPYQINNIKSICYLPLIFLLITSETPQTEALTSSPPPLNRPRPHGRHDANVPKPPLSPLHFQHPHGFQSRRRRASHPRRKPESDRRRRMFLGRRTPIQEALRRKGPSRRTSRVYRWRHQEPKLQECLFGTEWS